MAKIVVVIHALDNLLSGPYMLQGLFRHWREWGHRIRVVKGVPQEFDADLAILHVDLSVTPPEYAAVVSRFPVVVNGAVLDIRKSRISRLLVRPGDDWPGPVIVKSDFNFGGYPEWEKNRIATDLGLPPPCGTAPADFCRKYRIYPSIDRVPESAWKDPHTVVERFTPERDEKGYWLRTWVFFGDRGRCTRHCSPKRIVKAADVFLREPAEVPDDLRAERERLGFDYGKFDFVVHENRAVLFDANRTPGAAPNLGDVVVSGAGNLAHGVDFFLKRANA